MENKKEPKGGKKQRMKEIRNKPGKNIGSAQAVKC